MRGKYDRSHLGFEIVTLVSLTREDGRGLFQCVFASDSEAIAEFEITTFVSLTPPLLAGFREDILVYLPHTLRRAIIVSPKHVAVESAHTS